MNNPSQSVFLFMDRQHLQVNVKSAQITLCCSTEQNPWRCPNVFLADSENQGYSFQVVQPLPLPAPGSADLLGCGRHRGSPPSIHAWLRLPAQLSHVGKAFPLPPAETFRSKVMSSSPPVLLHKDLNLCSDIACFCSPLPAFGLIQFHPCVLFFFFFFLLKLPVFLLSAIFGSVPVSYFSTAFSFPLSHSSSFVYLNLHEHWFLRGWLFSWSRSVNNNGHSRNSLCCIKTEANITQVFTVVLRWTRISLFP